MTVLSSPVTSHDQVITVHGHRLLGRHLTPQTVRPDSPTVVFLHEALGSIGQWKTFPQTLCATLGLRGYVFDRIGYGGSDPLPADRTPDYLREQGEDWLPACLNAAGITTPPILFGHSDGGSIALYFAARHPTAAVVSLAAHVILEQITVAGIRAFGTLWQAGSDGGDLPARLARYHGDKTEAVYRGWHDTWLKPEFASFDMRPCLPRITCPTLVIQGEGDQYGTLQQVEDIVAGIAQGTPTCPPVAALLPGCGHIPHLEQPDQTIAVTHDFLRRHHLAA